jgi:hypothetical protein
MRFSRACLLVTTLLLTGCSTFKGWFTPEGQKVSQGKVLASQGRPHRASALAEEALAIDGRYPEARDLLASTFAPGQVQFHDETARWREATDPTRWDRLVDLYRDQETLGRLGPGLGPVLDPATGLALDLSVGPVTEALAEASAKAAQFHWDAARTLLAASPGPRQARLALAEGRRASGYDPGLPGLTDWLTLAQEKAAQKLMVIPFFWEFTGSAPPSPAALGSAISRRLLGPPSLPELTTVFSSDRLVTLPKAGGARMGLVSQPDAVALAASAGQNLVLLGQVTRAVYQEPRSVVTTANRVRQVVLVDPDHPQGITKTLKATVTTTEVTTSFELAATFAVIEVETGHDLVTALREAAVRDRIVLTTYTGDREALDPNDGPALAVRGTVAGAEALRERALEALALQVADAVREALK